MRRSVLWFLVVITTITCVSSIQPEQDEILDKVAGETHRILRSEARPTEFFVNMIKKVINWITERVYRRSKYEKLDKSHSEEPRKRVALPNSKRSKKKPHHVEMEPIGILKPTKDWSKHTTESSKHKKVRFSDGHRS